MKTRSVRKRTRHANWSVANVNQATRGANCLDRMIYEYISEPCYSDIKVVQSAVTSDHRAVIAFTGSIKVTYNKVNTKRIFRKQSPDTHAVFLSQLSQLQYQSDYTDDTQTEFGHFYEYLHALLDSFYPERTSPSPLEKQVT